MARRVRMSSDEAWAVLEHAHTGVLTSLRATKKFARVRNDPRVSFVVESGMEWAQLVGVHLTGRARFVEDGAQLDRVAAALDAKYASFRTPRPEMSSATRAHYETRTATIEIVPDERIMSWDNARLFDPEQA